MSVEESPGFSRGRGFKINTFLKELDYSIDIQMQQKIDRYCRCTFHTKDELNPTKNIKE